MKGVMAVGVFSRSKRRVWGAALLLGSVLSGCYGATERDDESDPTQADGGSAGSRSGSGSGAVDGSGGVAGGLGSSGGSSSVGGMAPLPEGPPTSVDLLFVIDNSISMADKQVLLSQAVPGLVSRLIRPNCVDDTGAVLGQSDSNGECAAGGAEFPAVTDLHIGIVTSSLGGHGGDVCAAPVEAGDTPDDHAQLLASQRGLPSWNDAGFLAWDPLQTANSPPGESDADALVSTFQTHVTAAGERGCGYEATLEAWYRFLVDPEPPLSVFKDASGLTVKDGTDETILAQRASFLRDDSLVYIVMLTDENDCSIIDEGQGWLIGLASGGFHVPRSTAACATDPNSPCCRSCATGEAASPDGCSSLAADPECSKSLSLEAIYDDLNLRCFDQKRRFGFDLLYPIERYHEGLTSSSVPDRAGNLVPNPLFAPDGVPTRHPSRVVLGGIVGVPWQDIADEESLTGDGLRFLSAAELTDQNRWDVILGDPDSYVPPVDPLMIESVDPRAGTHPILGVPIAPPDSLDPQENPINGHEQYTDNRTDLQYACIFPLATPRECTDTTTGCDCNVKDVAKNRPLCQPPEGGPAGTTQYFAKAYPGIRHLDLLKRMGSNAVVGSICPKTTAGDPLDPAQGYNPFARALVDQTKDLLQGIN